MVVLEDFEKNEKKFLNKFEKLLKIEKEDNPKCEKRNWNGSICGSDLKFNLVSGKYFCPYCTIKKSDEEQLSEMVESQNRLTGTAYHTLKKLNSDTLVRIMKIRDQRYNYLFNDWQVAVRGDRKAEFFLNQLNFFKEENGKLKDRIERFVLVGRMIYNNPRRAKELIERYFGKFVLDEK